MQSTIKILHKYVVCAFNSYITTLPTFKHIRRTAFPVCQFCMCSETQISFASKHRVQREAYPHDLPICKISRRNITIPCLILLSQKFQLYIPLTGEISASSILRVLHHVATHGQQ